MKHDPFPQLEHLEMRKDVEHVEIYASMPPARVEAEAEEPGKPKREWRWRFVAANGEIMGDSSEGYRRKIDMLSAAAKVLGGAFVDTDQGVMLVRLGGSVPVWRTEE